MVPQNQDQSINLQGQMTQQEDELLINLQGQITPQDHEQLVNLQGQMTIQDQEQLINLQGQLLEHTRYFDSQKYKIFSILPFLLTIASTVIGIFAGSKFDVNEFKPLYISLVVILCLISLGFSLGTLNNWITELYTYSLMRFVRRKIVALNELPIINKDIEIPFPQTRKKILKKMIRIRTCLAMFYCVLGGFSTTILTINLENTSSKLILIAFLATTAGLMIISLAVFIILFAPIKSNGKLKQLISKFLLFLSKKEK